ncbi:MAG: hypothetical protein JWL77_3474 [Chthonomonadaceae bacterium]|nr:hypothetical protein [Chthonomonadaceae bacterium]
MNHLTIQQIEGYHSGTLKLAEEYLAIVAQHVAVCARCRQDVATLQTFRQTVTPEIWAEARAATEAPATRPGFGEWLRAAIAGHAFRVWAPAMAFCLLLLMVFVWRNQQVVAIQDGSGRWALTRGGRLTGPKLSAMCHLKL